MAQLLYSVPDALEQVPISRSKFYELMASGAIRAVHIGSRTLIPHEELEQFIESLKAVSRGAA
jgi:excisionase family DNA binding protein